MIIKRKCSFLKRVLLALFALILMFSMCIPAFAAGNTKNKSITVKVAFYQLDGFFEYDEDGNPIGYGVDYLNELKKYANIDWEFIPVDSWEGIKPLLLDGSVDVRMPVSAPTAPSELYSYTIEPIMTSYHAIMTLNSRDDLYYHDYDTINDLKIAACSNLLEKTGVGSYLDSIGVTDNLVFYPDYNACRAALDSGEVDALISNVMDLTDDMKILDKLSVIDNYITTLKGNQYYTVINDAMTQLKLENPSFQADLYEKYFPQRAWEPFTKEETQYIESKKSITIAVYPDRKPVSYIDENGDFHGISIDMANLISERMGIPFTYIPVTTDSQPEMLAEADLVMPVPGNATIDNCFITQSILDSEILMAVHDNKVELKSGTRVGVLETTPGIRDTIVGLDMFDVRYYDSNREAFDALKNGDIDAFANSSYVINWMLQNPRYSNFQTLRYDSLPLDFSICGRDSDTVLQSVLAKVIHTISDEERDWIVQNGTKLMMDDFTLSDRFYVYKIQIICIVVVVLLIIMLLVFYNYSKSKYIKRIEEGSKKLEEASLAKSDFLSRMSHDMRTPMNGILGITHLLRDRTDPEEISGDVKQIEMSAKYLLSLINDTLDMSKIESGKMELHPEPILSEDLFSNVIATSRILASQKGVLLKLEFPPIEHGHWVPVMADAPRVEQIFVNLISNAVKFTPKDGTVTLHMDTVDITEDSVTDRYIVSDTGIGMSEEFQRHLFEPFSQEGRELSSGNGGTGLGLAIVKQIVELMDGSISVKSDENKGTSFTVLLTYPRYHGELMKKAEIRADLSILKGKRILLCEDHPVNAQIATRLLENKDMLVDRADNGKTGVQMFESSAENHYDAILMDIRMPVMNGIDATKAIRALHDRSDASQVPIIAMTANAFEDDKKKTKDSGMNAHLAKPVEPDVLYQVLAEQILQNTQSHNDC